MGFDLDFTTTTTQEVEAKNGVMPDGFHRVKLESTAQNGQDARQEFNFVVSHGPFAGRKMRVFKLDDPQFSNNPEMASNKARVWAVRMGVVGQDANGKKVSVNWQAAVGKEFVLEIETRQYDDKDGKRRTTQEPKFAGIFPLEHTDIPNHARRAMGLPEIAGNEGVTRDGGAKAGSGGKGANGKGGAAAPADPAKTAAESDAAAKALFG